MKHVTKTWFRDILAAAALGVVATAAVALLRQPRAGAKVTSNASMLQGREYLDGLRARLQVPSRSPQSQDLQIDALQALYLARVRTGLGSPFRAIESALRDPWLPDSVRAPLASAMLATAMSSGRTATGALAVSPSNAKLIDSVVRAHPEPRRGEETVRIAFDLAAAAGAISPTEATTAVELAAVARDAVYARRDVARLIAAAHRGGLTPLELLPIWREERRFEVERPVVHPIDWASSREAVASAARLFELLDAERPADSTSQGDGDQVTQAVRDAARRLARARNAPPSPAVLQVTGGLLSSRLSPPATEEELAAGWLNAATLPAADAKAWARVVTAASVRLRTTVQDPVWFAGDPGPTVVELQQRHGLRSVTFAAAVPTAWRDYALQSIDRALLDARRVLPDLDLRGLRIHVGLKANWPARAMALHDPETRTIYFPLSSAPGVMAHELGHDLDWQVARSVFGEQGIYATDGTARRASEILAAPVEILTGGGAGAVGGGVNARSAVSMRPTEVLARHVDWMMAAALASLGRSNGFLSTVQESGDALGNSSAPGAEQIDAALSVLATATRVPGHTLHDVRARGNQPLVRDVISRALSTNLGMPWFKRTSVVAAGPLVEALGNAPLALRNAADPRLARRCMAASAHAAAEPDWVADALTLAADARAREVIRRVRRAPPRRFGMRDVGGWAMLRNGLAAGPVDPEIRARSVAMLRREIEWQLTAEMLTPLAEASQAGGPLLCDWR